MNPHEEQLLIGYLLQALDEQQHRQVAQRLHHDPLWQQQAQRWSRVLQRLEAARTTPEPPEHLVRRTLEAVRRQEPPAASSRQEPPVSAPTFRRWRSLDAVMLAVVRAAAMLLLVPAVSYQRFRAQVLHCSDNLRYLGQALEQYHRIHNHFPEVPAESPLGLASGFVPLLYQNHLLDDPARLLCYVTPRRVERLKLLTVEQLEQLPPKRRETLLARMSGDYGYCIGYLAPDGRYVSFHCRSDGYLALLADAPDRALSGRPGNNHGPWGFNVLYASGAVRFVNSVDPTGKDHLFCNRLGRVGAGCDPQDTVIVPGSMPVLLALDQTP